MLILVETIIDRLVGMIRLHIYFQTLDLLDWVYIINIRLLLYIAERVHGHTMFLTLA